VKKITLLLALWAPFQVLADAAATGKAIAEALNQRDVEGVMRQMDVDAVTRLVLKDLGMGAKDRESVAKGFPKALRNNIDIGMRSIEGSKGSARFLRTGARDGKPFALLRYDLGDNGTEYVEYYVTAADKVEDWYAHSMATRYSTSAALGLATVFKTDSMLFAVLGVRTASDADAKPFQALRANLQAQDFPGAYRTLDTFPESFRKTRQWAVMRVTYAGRVDEATHRSALRHLAQNFGAEPELQFMLIDHYVFESQFDRALTAVGALEKAIGGVDGASANIRGSILMGAKRYPEAEKACRQGISVEPDHKNAYWCLVGVGIATNNGKIAVDGLKAFEKAFDTEFDLDKLGQLENYQRIAKTPEFAAWKKSRR